MIEERLAHIPDLVDHPYEWAYPIFHYLNNEPDKVKVIIITYSQEAATLVALKWV